MHDISYAKLKGRGWLGKGRAKTNGTMETGHRVYSLHNRVHGYNNLLQINNIGEGPNVYNIEIYIR